MVKLPPKPIDLSWLGKLAQLAALATTAVVLVEWIPVLFKHYGINWKAVMAAVGIPALTGAYNLSRSQLQKIQAANEAVQIENARRINTLEDRLDSTILQLSRFDDLNRIDAEVMERLSQLQVQIDGHLQQYGHPPLSEDFRLLQRTVEELRAVAYRFDRLIQLEVRIEELRQDVKRLKQDD